LRRGLVSGGPTPSDAWSVDPAPHREQAEARLKKVEPIHALITEWCGQEAREEFAEVLALREEVDRLRKLLQETAYNGHPVKAGLLRKQLDDVRPTRG
jgi:hypothetical protein